jgi:hypothetical protein
METKNSMNEKKPLRKSEKKEAKKGNKAKHDAYREAFARIEAANESQFFLEAVAIQEAIISDRLKSHLGHLGKLPKRKRPTLSDLVDAWKSENQSQRLEIKINLAELVDQWRVLRNQAVHGLVATHSVIDFLESAEVAAKTGEILARAVCDWHKGEVRKAKLNNKSKKIS